MSYVPPPMDIDPAVLLQRADDDLATRHPDVRLTDGSLIRWMVETDAHTAADSAALAQEVGEGIIREVLARLLAEPQRSATAATSTATIAVTGDTTVTIPAGTYLEGTTSSGEPCTVATTTDVTIAAGTTSAVGVQVAAVEPGAAANGVEGELLGMEVWPWGVSAALDEPLAGGTEAETPEQHMTRLVGLARLTRPRPILPEEFAEYVRWLVPGVGAAVALNLTRPGPPVETGVERCVTVGIRAADGLRPSGEVIVDAQAALDAVREVTFESNVRAADYTLVGVTATVRVWPGYDDDQTVAMCQDAIRRYLSPATWGAPPLSGDEAPQWANQPIVRREEIVEALGRDVPAVDWVPIDSITLTGQPVDDTGAPDGPPIAGSPDLTLPGLLPLPRPDTTPGAIAITVVPR